MMMVIMMAEEQTNHTMVAFDPPQSAAVDIKVERFQRADCCAIKMLAKAHQQCVDGAQPAVM